MKSIKIILLLSTCLLGGNGYSLTCPPAETVKQFIENKKTKALYDKLNYEGLSYQLYDYVNFYASMVNLEHILKTDYKIIDQFFLTTTTNPEGSALVCSYRFYFYSMPYHSYSSLPKHINLISLDVNKNHGGFINPHTTWKIIKYEDLEMIFKKNKSWEKEIMNLRCGYYDDIRGDSVIKECAFSLGGSIKNQ